MSKSKDLEGLGYLETRKMNACLLTKWIFKLEKEPHDLCSELLHNKYMKVGRSFFLSSDKNAFQFWKGIQGIKEHCDL